MQVGNVGSPTISTLIPKPAESAESPGPDRDGDSDDTSIKSATAPGVGAKVDTTA